MTLIRVKTTPPKNIIYYYTPLNYDLADAELDECIDNDDMYVVKSPYYCLCRSYVLKNTSTTFRYILTRTGTT